MNSTEERKTSEQWEQEVGARFGVDGPRMRIYDPDGWDRKNIQFSFYEELITLDEFRKRVACSTLLPMENPNL